METLNCMDVSLWADSPGAVKKYCNTLRDIFDMNDLHFAAFVGKDKVCKKLLKAGHEVDAETRYGYTALLFAAFGGNDEVCRLLLEHGADRSRIPVAAKEMEVSNKGGAQRNVNDVIASAQAVMEKTKLQSVLVGCHATQTSTQRLM